MSIQYPSFTYHNESIIIIPGNQLTIKQLKSRLNLMDVDAINIDSKEQLVNLYELSLKEDKNKFKLFELLKKDTENYYFKTGINLNRQMLIPQRDESIIIQETNKEINLNNNSNFQPYEENSYAETYRQRQGINLNGPNKRIMNNINIKNASLISENYKQNIDNKYDEEEDFKNNNYNYKDYIRGNNQNYKNLKSNETEHNYSSNRINYNHDNINNNNESFMQKNIDNNNKTLFNNNLSTNFHVNPENKYEDKKTRNQNNVNNNQNENIKIKEPEEELNFSLFDGFTFFRKAKEICNSLIIWFITILVIFIFNFIYNFINIRYSKQINELSDLIIETLVNFFMAILIFSIDYWYIFPIIFIILIILITIINLWKRYQIKKKCEKIMKKILDDLSNERVERVISEEYIYRRYFQEYGISWEKFTKIYLPLLEEMKSKNKKIKTIPEIIEGKKVIFWEYQD